MILATTKPLFTEDYTVSSQLLQTLTTENVYIGFENCTFYQTTALSDLLKFTCNDGETHNVHICVNGSVTLNATLGASINLSDKPNIHVYFEGEPGSTLRLEFIRGYVQGTLHVVGANVVIEVYKNWQDQAAGTIVVDEADLNNGQNGWSIYIITWN